MVVTSFANSTAAYFFIQKIMEIKIKTWLRDEINSLKEVIAEYESDARPKCVNGSDDFIEGQVYLAEKLLFQIAEWEQQRLEKIRSKRK